VYLYNIELFNLIALLVVITLNISNSKYFIQLETLFIIFNILELQLFSKKIKQINAFL